MPDLDQFRRLRGIRIIGACLLAMPLSFSTKLLDLVWMSIESVRMLLQSTDFMSFR